MSNDTEGSGIKRDSVSNNCNPELSRYQEATLGQARIEQNFLGFINSRDSVEVRWNTSPTDLEILHKDSEHPVQVNVETNSGKEVWEFSVELSLHLRPVNADHVRPHKD